MDKLINLPFQGVINAILHIIPRRCHWAKIRYGFQSCKMKPVCNILNIKSIRAFLSFFNLRPERAILIQPNGNALGYECVPRQTLRPERAN
jgi:hypothetical protein